MAATLRTAKKNEVIPTARPVTFFQSVGQSFYRGRQVKNICMACALEYCPNFHLYATPTDIPTGVTLSAVNPCDICGAKSGKYSGGVTDPTNLGGMRIGL